MRLLGQITEMTTYECAVESYEKLVLDLELALTA
jgi:hypothetical protein